MYLFVSLCKRKRFLQNLGGLVSLRQEPIMSLFRGNDFYPGTVGKVVGKLFNLAQGIEAVSIHCTNNRWYFAGF